METNEKPDAVKSQAQTQTNAHSQSQGSSQDGVDVSNAADPVAEDSQNELEQQSDSETANEHQDEENVTRLEYEGKELILIGTAHVSKRSAEQVKEIIDREQPDTVCVELDQQRYHSITAGQKWKDTDIFRIVKEKKATLLLMNLIISSFQRRMAKQFGVTPGQEMIQGINSAKENNARLVLADRDIQVTFQRVWHGIGLIGKLKLMIQILMSLVAGEEITEEEMEAMKSKDLLAAMLEEFTDSFPQLKKPLIDERDQYLSQKIKTAPGQKIVAVLGAAHVPGILEQIHHEQDLRSLSQVPQKSRWPRIIPWLIPLVILGIIGYTFFLNRDIGISQSISWVLWNGSFSALGALVAWGHPLTILAAFLAAPLSSLNPFLAAGWIAGIVEALVRRPRVQDFESLGDDLTTFRGFWTNKVTKVLLVVALTNVGSTIGTFIGGADVIRRFLEAIGG